MGVNYRLPDSRVGCHVAHRRHAAPKRAEAFEKPMRAMLVPLC